MTNDKELVEVWRQQFELMIGDENTKKNGRPFNVVGYSHLSPKEGSYRLPSIESMWQGYLMAKRTQPSVVLPKDDGTIAQNAYQLDVIAQITAAGIKYTIGE